MFTLPRLSVAGIEAIDLLTGTLAGNEGFAIGWFSFVSVLTLLLKRAPLSVDIDLLIGGDGDLGFPELELVVDLSSAKNGIFITSFSVNVEGNLDLLCFPEE